MIGAGHTKTVRAFTLLELLVATSLTAIIGSMAATLVIESSRVRSGAAVRAELTESAARSLEQILRYVREISQDAGMTGQAQIISAASTALAFDDYGFRLNGNNLEMSDDARTTWQVMTRDLASFSLHYYMADGTELTPTPLNPAQCAAVRQIAVEIRLERGTEAVQMRSRVYLRSFQNEASS